MSQGNMMVRKLTGNDKSRAGKPTKSPLADPVPAKRTTDSKQQFRNGRQNCGHESGKSRHQKFLLI